MWLRSVQQEEAQEDKSASLDMKEEITVHIEHALSSQHMASLTVVPDLLISDLKARLAQPTNTPVQYQQLLREGDVQPLTNTQRLSELSLHDKGSLLFCRLSVDHDELENNFREVLISADEISLRAHISYRLDLSIDLSPWAARILHTAVMRGMYNMCTWAVSEEMFACHMSAKTRDGASLLHLAAAGGFVDICNLLLGHARFSEHNAVDMSGATALHYAARRGHLEICKLLLQDSKFKKANASDNKYNTACAYAERNGHHDLRGFLKAAGCR